MYLELRDDNQNVIDIDIISGYHFAPWGAYKLKGGEWVKLESQEAREALINLLTNECDQNVSK